LGVEVLQLLDQPREILRAWSDRSVRLRVRGAGEQLRGDGLDLSEDFLAAIRYRLTRSFGLARTTDNKQCKQGPPSGGYAIEMQNASRTRSKVLE